jgi:hypothetical protein
MTRDLGPETWDRDKRLMIGQTEPNSLTNFVNIIAEIDEQLCFIDNPSQSTQQQPSHQTNRRDPNAMDLYTVGQRYKGTYAPFDSKEQAQRLENNLRFKCGKSGHISPDCSVSTELIVVKNNLNVDNISRALQGRVHIDCQILLTVENESIIIMQ